jgi:putative aldouronate transport system substrate-binding protein
MSGRRILLSVAVLLCVIVGGAFAKGEAESSTATGAPVTLSLYMPGDSQPDEKSVEAALAAYAVPKINASLDLNMIGWGEWFDKKRLMIASGEEFDIGFTAIWSQFEDEVARNAWIPLNDLIDTYAPKIRSIVGDFLMGPTINGKIYAISTVKEKADGGQFLLNKKYADKYAIPYTKLKSLDEVEPWLAKIKAGDPDIAGWFMNPGDTNLQGVALSYYEPIYGSDYYLDTDGTIRHKYHMDLVWKELARAHRWFKAGYFQADLEDEIVAKNESDKLKEGKWVFYHHTAHPGKAGEMTGTNGFPIVAGGPYQQPVVKQMMLLGSMMAISRTSKHPVEAIKMLDLMNEDKYVNNLLNFGVEGKHWKFVDNKKGIITPIKDSGYDPNMTWALQNQFMNYLRDFEDPDKWEKYKKFNASAKLGKAVGFFPDVNPVKTEIAAMTNALDEYKDVLDAGVLDPAAVKGALLAKIKAAGVDAVEAELQRQYVAFKAAKK